MPVKAPTAKRFLVFAQWYLTPVGGVYTAVVVAGLVLALADSLPAAVLILTAGLLVVLRGQQEVTAWEESLAAGEAERFREELESLLQDA